MIMIMMSNKSNMYQQNRRYNWRDIPKDLSVKIRFKTKQGTRIFVYVSNRPPKPFVKHGTGINAESCDSFFKEHYLNDYVAL